MTTIEIERSKLRCYAIIGLTTIFYSGMGSLMFWMFSNLVKSGNDLRPKDYFGLVFGCFSFFMAVYSIIRYFKNSPKVVVDNRQISINDESYYWTEIAQIDLTGKRPFKYIFNFPLEGTMLTLKDGTVKYFFDDMYSNSWKVKSFIQQVIINGKESAEITTHKVDQIEIRLESFEIFKGNQFTSFRGISLWGMIGFFSFMLLSKGNVPLWRAIVFVGIFCSFWFFLNSYLMDYFALSDKYFVVRNHNFIWKNNVYRIDDIKEIVFETRQKMPNCLRIITKDFRNKLYRAGTLRDKTWLDLKDKLELKGITVRNECI
jgi:hypothetical protein